MTRAFVRDQCEFEFDLQKMESNQSSLRRVDFWKPYRSLSDYSCDCSESNSQTTLLSSSGCTAGTCVKQLCKLCLVQILSPGFIGPPHRPQVQPHKKKSAKSGRGRRCRFRHKVVHQQQLYIYGRQDLLPTPCLN